jgi:hypothetical protein
MVASKQRITLMANIQWLHTTVWEAVLTFSDESGPVDLTGAQISIRFAKIGSFGSTVATASVSDGKLVILDQTTNRGKAQLTINPEDREFTPTASLTDIVGDFIAVEGGKPKWRGRMAATVVKGV